jgi:hypothetical protein
MSSWLEILLLALASMFWPTLITVVVLALRVPHPIKILLWFVAGGLLTTVSIGLVLVFTLQGSDFVSGSKPPANPVLNIALGLLAIAIALVVARRRGSRTNASSPAEPDTASKTPSFTERAVQRGAAVAFLAGVVLNIVPGAFPFVALKDIAQLDIGDGAKVVAVVVFYVIMFAFAEVPIVAFLFAPERTTAEVTRFNTWLRRNGTRVAVYVLIAVGIYLIARGTFQAVQ